MLDTINDIMENKEKIFTEELLQYIDLYEDEKIIKIIGRNLKSFYVPRIVRAILYWIVIIPAWIILHNHIFTNFDVIHIIDIVFQIIVAIWAIGFISSIIIGKPFVHGHRYAITTSRIILYRKFLGVSFREIEYKRITDLVLYQPFFGRIWNYGNLMPVTAGIEMGVGKMGRFSLEGITDVFEIRLLILNQIREIQKQILADFQQKALQKKHDEHHPMNPEIDSSNQKME